MHLHNFSGSALTSVFLKCRNLEQLKKVPKQHEAECKYGTIADFLLAVLKNTLNRFFVASCKMINLLAA